MHLRSLAPLGARRALIGASALLLATAAAPGATAQMTRPPAPARASASPFAGAKLYVNAESEPARQARALRAVRPRDAALLDRIGREPESRWIGDWSRDVRGEVNGAVSAAARAGAVAVLVAYNIPQRDCGSYSAGGAESAEAYRQWIRDFARGIGGRRVAVVLEPDALAGMDCLPAQGQDERVALIRDAVQELAKAGASVYIDAGHARWIGAEEMGRRLEAAGVAQARGFALNVSNFHGTADNVAYGERLSARVGGKHFVVDTSRNGMGSVAAENWCNPKGQALGVSPTARTGRPLVDAFLWIKRPGESDGTCNGGPQAGGWWTEYALGLAQRQASGGAVARLSPR